MGNCAERTFARIVDWIVNTCINLRASFCNQTREEFRLNKDPRIVAVRYGVDLGARGCWACRLADAVGRFCDFLFQRSLGTFEFRGVHRLVVPIDECLLKIHKEAARFILIVEFKISE